VDNTRKRSNEYGLSHRAFPNWKSELLGFNDDDDVDNYDVNDDDDDDCIQCFLLLFLFCFVLFFVFFNFNLKDNGK